MKIGLEIENICFNPPEHIQIDLSKLSDCSHGYFRNVYFENIDFCNANFADAYFQNVEFCEVNLSRSSFKNSYFKNIDFNQVNLSDTNFYSAQFILCKFKDCQLKNTSFRQAFFRPIPENSKRPRLEQSCNFSYSDGNINKEEYLIEGCDFNEINTRFMIFSNMNFYKCSFQDSGLYFADFSSTRLFNCQFDRSIMKGVLLTQSNIDNCSFNGTVLFASKLLESKFTDCHLIGSDLRNANLTSSVINRCFLTGAKFYQTNRGELKINILDEVNEKDPHSLEKAKKYIKFVDWTPDGTGELQIDIQRFKQIVNGEESPVHVVLGTSEAATKIYVDASSRAVSQTGEENTYSDASTNVTGDVNESSVEGGQINSDNEEEVVSDENHKNSEGQSSQDKNN